MLKSGTVCDLAEESCVDSDDGYTFWEGISNTACGFESYDVLYEGTSTKFIGLLNSQNTTIFTLESQDTTFALTLTRRHIIYGYTLRSRITVINLDLFTYANSKFVYVEKYMRS